jgi:hypothetical protein
MNAVGSVEVGIQCDASKQERNEGYGVLCCKGGKQAVEGKRVVPAVSRRRFHAAEEDADVPVLNVFDDAREILLHRFYRHAAQAVVRAELEDDRRG